MSKTLLKAGLSVVDITPPVGTELGGFGFRTKASNGIHTPLYAKTLCLQTEEGTVAITACDIILLTAAQKRRALELMGERGPVGSASWMLTCTHTHSGPETWDYLHAKRIDEQYIEVMLQRVAQSVNDAFDDLEPCKLSIGATTIEGIAANRHVLADDGKARYECWLGEAQGRIDEVMRMVCVTTAAGRPKAIVSNYVCHPITVAEKIHGSDRLISGDFPAVAARLVKERTGYELLYTNGCAGDINPRDGVCVGPEVTEAIGQRMASFIEDSLSQCEAMPTATLAWSSRNLALRFESVPTLEELTELLTKNEKHVITGSVCEMTLEHRFDVMTILEWARTFRHLAKLGVKYPEPQCEIQLFRIGTYSIAALPFDAFLEIGQKCQEVLGADRSIVVGYANGFLGYLVPPQTHEEGGYEAARSHRVFGYPGAFWRHTDSAIYELLSSMSASLMLTEARG
jgi:hypothetical protein